MLVKEDERTIHPQRRDHTARLARNEHIERLLDAPQDEHGRPLEHGRTWPWLCYFLLVFLLAFAVSLEVLGSSMGEATMFAASVTLSSTDRVRQAVDESDCRSLPIGRALVEMLPFQDLLLAPILAVPTVLHQHLSSHGLSFELVQLLLTDALWLLLIVFMPQVLIPALLKILTTTSSNAQKGSTELLTIVVISFCLGMALLSEYLSLSYSFGALVSGVLWARVNEDLGPENSENVRRAEGVVRTLASLFGSLYLACLGMIVSPEFILHHASQILLLMAFVALLKTTVAAVVLRRCFRFPWAAAAAGGVSLGHLSITALFFTGRAQELGLMSREMHLTTLSGVFLCTALAPLDAMAMRWARRLPLNLNQLSPCCCCRAPTAPKRDT